ncbi:MAG: 3-phosphoshikimate 1-carboxyvinyltransferase, partial [Muribaculaceae bacterium]|nr:3-phosphoshikimate 1-carboxyvinyltransferase [Muribaculaceae bacterium]
MIWPPENPVKAEINLPPSKSESNRLVIIRAMTPEVDPRSAGLRDCDDTRAILEGIAAADGTRVDVGPAGTAMRFLTAYYAATPGKRVTLDGNERMRQRPIGPLVEALRQCGASVEYAGAEGVPPLRIEGRRLTGGEIEIDATVSSQFISALMMVAPVMERGITLTLKGRAISRPYVEMTAGLMRMAGAEVESGSDCVRVAPGRYRPFDYEAEGDWSAASYWFEIAVLSAGSITLKPLYDRSLQGDRRVETLMRATGLTMRRTDEDSVMPTPTIYAEPQIVADLSNTPDLAQTMAVTCCLAGIRFLFTGLESLT